MLHRLSRLSEQPKRQEYQSKPQYGARHTLCDFGMAEAEDEDADGNEQRRQHMNIEGEDARDDAGAEHAGSVIEAP